MQITNNNATVMNKLRQSPTGQKLLQEAEKKGVKINFAANNGDNVMGQYNPNNNTITVEANSLEKMVETLGHELVHATTRENGNSMNEETNAFIIGEKIASEAGVDANPHHADFWRNHVANAYSGLAQDNGIMSKLNALGISPTGTNPATAAGGNNANVGNYAAGNNVAAAAPTAAPTAANANPFGADPAANQNAAGQPGGMMGAMMQMMMMFMQMFMQMFMNQGQNQGQNNNNNNLFNNNNPQKMIGFQGLNLTA